MRFDILTIFPDLLTSPLQEGIIRRARQDDKIQVAIHNIRDFATDKHAMTDDRPFGGGEGMVMKPEPISAALAKVRDETGPGRVVFLSPQGSAFTQKKAEELAQLDHLILLCGRYEGVDERVVDLYVDEEISIGDYILTGGELAAMVMIDAITRLQPGVLGCADSVDQDTFSRGMLKHPQYTRPRQFQGLDVPGELLSGDHALVREWRLVAAVRQTLAKRPELLAEVDFSTAEEKILRKAGLWGEIELVLTSKDVSLT
ncbi:MAG: tRNA (guanosine(37)-N1)-methyltransferase TrmD [Desulfobulbaceae bacterium]|nr:tRNA (guanosine(37)-N1)-methyltransferase TrmD [Desulfobulbaceae bacterium]